MSASDGTFTSNTVGVTVASTAAASLTLSAASGTLTAGNTDQLTITAYDTYGNVATGYTGDKTFTFAGANSIGSYHPTVTNKTNSAVNFGTSETLTFTNGVSTAGGLMTLYKVENASITANDGTFTSNAVGVTVSPAAAASLTLSAASGSITAGATDQLTITAYDTYGNVATGYTGDKTFTFSGANTIGSYHPTVTDKTNSAVNFGTSETLTFTNGVSTAGGLMTLYKVQSASITATDGIFTSNAANVSVTPSSAVSLGLSANSGSMLAGNTNQLTITAYDTYGNVATSYSGDKSVSFSGATNIGAYYPTVTDKSGALKTFGTSTTITFTNGVSSAGGLMTLYKAGATSISATIGSMTTNGVSVTVSPAAAASLTLSAASNSITAGATDQLTITAYDTYGNTATSYAGAKAFTFSGASGSPDGTSPTVTDNASSAIHFGTVENLTFTNGVSTAGGLMTLYDAQTAAVSATNGTFTSNTVSVTVSASAAASLTLTAAGSTMPAGSTDQLTVTAYDTYGNVASSYTGNKTYTFSGAGTVGSYHPTVTDKNGTAVNFGTSETLTFTNGVSTAGGLMTLYKAGNALIIANDGTLSSNAVSMTVNPLSAVSLTLSAISGSITAGTTDQLTITAYDTYGNVATSYTGDKTFTFSGASVSAYGNHPTVTDKNGTAINFGASETLTFTNGVSTAGGLMTLYKAETASVSATSSALTSNSVPVTVSSAAAVSLTLSAASGSITAGATDQLTITAYDTYGNVATGYTGDKTFTFSGANTIGSYHPTVTNKTGGAVDFGTSETMTFTNGVSSAGGLMTLYKAQNASITANDGTFTTNTLNVAVTPGAAVSLELTAASNTMSAGSTNQLTVTAYDTYGNVATGYTGDKTFTFSGASNFNSYIPNVTDKTGAAVDLGMPTTITFTNGVSTAGGLMTLYKVENASMVAGDGTLTSNTVGITVTPAVAVRLVLTPATTTLTAGDTDQLTITAYDVFGNVATTYSGNRAFTFSGAGAIGVYSPTVTDLSGTAAGFGTSELLTFTNGVSTAGGLMRLYKAQTFGLSATDGHLTSATVTITVNAGAASSLVLTAPSALLTVGMTDQLGLTAFDPYGNVAVSYTGDKTFTFDAAGLGSANLPTVTDASGRPVVLGTGEVLGFTDGVLTAGGLMNMTKIEQISISATDSQLTSNPVTVRFYITLGPLFSNVTSAPAMPIGQASFGPVKSSQGRPGDISGDVQAFINMYDQGKYAQALTLAEEILAQSSGEPLASTGPELWSDKMADVFIRYGEVRNAILWQERALTYLKPQDLPEGIFKLWQMMERYEQLVGPQMYLQDMQVSGGESGGELKRLRQRLKKALLFHGTMRQVVQAEIKAVFYFQHLDFVRAKEQCRRAIAMLDQMDRTSNPAWIKEEQKADWQLLAQIVYMEGALAQRILAHSYLQQFLFNPLPPLTAGGLTGFTSINP
ncbi:MAG: hypothetical protein KGJ61_08700 [Candidatus Omnitrophica bacterium]|nr:hypothetical protein [Candidatus Omnitrophota bacterium]